MPKSKEIQLVLQIYGYPDGDHFTISGYFDGRKIEFKEVIPPDVAPEKYADLYRDSLFRTMMAELASFIIASKKEADGG